MDHLPVVLGRGQPFLEAVSSSRGNNRSVCPRGRLLALVKARGEVAVHSLARECREAVIASGCFTSVQWVCPSHTPSDCVVDTAQSAHGQLVGVGGGGDVTWWRVREGGDGQEEGEKEGEKETVRVEELAVLQRAEMTAELRRLGYALEVSSVLPLGSSDGTVQLLVNSTHLCRVALDHEFSKLAVLACMSVEPSLQGMADELLPARVGRVVDAVYCPPLLLQLCHEGTVFIHHMERGVCVGVVSTIHYCHYTSSRQPESEELLSQISMALFTHMAVTSDLCQLTATTHMNHVLLVNLRDYFEVFPSHYHPQFLSLLSHRQRAVSKRRKKHRAHSITSEEDEELARYGGGPPSSESHFHSSSRERSFPGGYAWGQRWKQLAHKVAGFEPGGRQGLNYAGTSGLTVSKLSEVSEVGKMESQRAGKREGGFEEEAEGKKKAWYEEPSRGVLFGRDGSTFDLPYISNIRKMSQTSIQSSPAEESDSHSNDPGGGIGTETRQKHSYSTSSLLPPPSLPRGGGKWEVVHVSVQVGMVMVYCGECEKGEGVEGELGCLAVNRCPVKAVAVYQTDAMHYSVTECHRAVWVLPPPCPSLPHYLLSSHSLALAAFSLSQEEFVSKLLMYGSAVVAEEVCRLNRWDRCSLPINALETALELRQLDTVSFFLRSRESDPREPSESVTAPTPADIPTLPPIPLDQLDTAIAMLLVAIRKNHHDHHTSQYASRLLIMTLAFLTRMIKGQALFEERTGEEIAEEEEAEAEEEEKGGEEEVQELLVVEENVQSVNNRYRTVSGTSVESVPAPGTQTVVSLPTLTGYIQQLRAYLPNAALIGLQEPAWRDEEEEEEEEGEGVDSPFPSPPHTPPLDRRLTATWSRMDTKEVVRDALLRGCMPLAQAYLLHRKTGPVRKPDQTLALPAYRDENLLLSDAIEAPPSSVSLRLSPAVPTREDARLSAVLSTASGFVLEALEKRSMKLATSLLTQMCMDVKSSLSHICFHTINRTLRDFLAGELQTRGWLSEKESQALDYLHLLETYYPLQSYDEAQSLQSKQHPRRMAYQSTSLPFVPGIVTKTTSIPPVGDLHQLYPETFGGSHSLSQVAIPTSPLTSPPTKGVPLYLQVPLSAVVDWDPLTRQRLLFEMFVLKSQTDGTECEQLVSKEQVFDYLVRHNDSESALRFIMSRVPPLGNPSPCPAHIISLCAYVPQSVEHLRDAILDDLARQGVLLSTELQNLPLLLPRLGRTHSLFSQPHPLSKSPAHATSESSDSGSGCAENNEETALASLEDFHSAFLHYCIENGFASLMYHYMDYYSLALDEASIAALGLDTAEELWVDTMLQFRLLALNPLNPTAMFQASLSSSRLLLHTPGSSVMGMLQYSRTLMAVASLMFAPAPLEEALSPSSSDQPWYVDPSVLKPAVAAYPTLQAALFPPPPTSLTAAQSQDITVYQLLQGSVPFDVSRLFKWQTTNTLAVLEDASEGSHDIPHFSQPALADRFARVEHLTYIHYLCRGQPSFAFANFVAAKLLGRSHVSKRLDRAISRVYRLALQDFTNSRLVSSCAAFIEMLDRDSRLLRIDVQAALRIAHHGNQTLQTERIPLQGRAKEEPRKYRKITSQFIQLHGNSEDKALSSGLLRQLETATHTLVSTASLERCSLESEEHWSLVQAFCGCHSLPPSSAFLCVCAQDGQWLPLLCHAQLYAIPPQKVLPIIEKHFSNTHIREHLRLALSSMDTSNPTTPTALKKGDGFTEKPKSRRRRTASRTRMQQAESLVRTQPDLRAKLYSKIGLQRERSPMPAVIKPNAKPAEKLSPTHNLTVSPDQECPVALEEDNLPDDLFSVLFKCQSYDCSWRALLAHAIALQRPVLAILAACHEDAMMVDCMCAWLYCTLGCDQLSKATVLLGLTNAQDDVSGSQAQFNAALQWHHWSPHDLAMVLVVSLQLPASDTAPHLTLAFQYFDLNNPLLSFFQFHEQFSLSCDLDQCKKNLLEFDLAMTKCSSAVGYLGVIGDVFWVERLANMVASHMLVMCPTPFERTHLLRLLNEGTFGQGFQCSVLNFRDLHQMSKVLSEAGLPSDAAFTIREHFTVTPGAKSLAEVYSVRVRVDSDRVLGMLLEKAQFSIARNYASIVGSTASEVTVKEAEHNLRKLAESSYWQYEQARLNFWHSCNSSFTAERVDPELAAEFFESVVHHSSEPPTSASPSASPSASLHSFPPLHCSATERALVLAFALKWRRETDTMTGDQLKDFEREIWLSHIHATVEDMQRPPGAKTGSSPLPFLPSCGPEAILSSEDPSSLLSTLSVTVSPSYGGQRRLSELVLPDNIPVLTEAGQRKESSSLTNREEVKAFNMMLGRLLNAGFISQARELAALFEHDSPDLTIVLCCIQLAQGKLSPEQLTEQVLSLVSTHSPRHLSDLSLSFEQRGDSRPSVEIVRMMQKLSDRAKHAQQCCSCVITCFKIAVCLRQSYTSVVTADPFSILTQVLSSRYTDRYLLAEKFVSGCKLKPKEVAGYLSDCVASALQAQLGGAKEGRESPRHRVYYAQMNSSQFVELAQLCPDHNEFGGHLLSMAKSLSHNEQPTSGNLSVQVELLVRAHDCYTLGCSVDGISEVLLVVKQWVPTLLSLKHFSLMVRLLTGIGRFYEMSYILQLLMENDQFESLLHTGMEKEEQLRVALMDYLRAHHANDHEKMQMVALKFGMFHELAKTRQEQAKRDLKKIRPKHLATNNPETVKTLKTVFETLRTAAKTYSQEDCLSSAQHCYSLARLVALQLSVLQSGRQVINLDNKKVVRLMEELPFQEALIVADAYKRTSWTDWINPLYKKVIVGGHFRYLSDFKSAFPLKANMFQELASKYQHDREKPPESAGNMKRLLTHLRNLPLKRKLATDLGLSDVLQSLSPTQDEGFLNDVARL